MNYSFITIPFLLFSLSFATISHNQPSIAQMKPQIENIANKSVGDTSEVSLDWNGIYQGILPCADCEGIQTKITLHLDKSYVIETKYLDKEAKTFNNKGNFVWNQAGNTIILDNLEDSPSQYFVGEDMLIQLDIKGNKITGDLAQKYILNKVARNETNLTDTKWQLVEIMGQKVAKKDIYIKFNSDGKAINGFDGCNLFMGEYETQMGNRLKFKQMMSTMRACIDMGKEDQFMELLQKVDNYTITDNVLSLNKARMSTLLKFIALKDK